MYVATVSGNEISDTESPLLKDDVVRHVVDFNGRPVHRSKSGCWTAAYFIIGVEVAERLIYYGISSNLVTYLTGPLGQSTAAAAANVNAWLGTVSLLPLLGAFIADSYLGRYRMIIVSSLLYILGLGFLSLATTVFNSSDCQNAGNGCSPSLFQIIFFFFSLYLVAFAQGGHRPCLQAFGADQFDEEDEQEYKSKSAFFNWWYFSSCVSVTVGILCLNYVEDNLSWGLCFGISCIVMFFALCLFLLEGECCPVADIDEAKVILRLVPILCACLGYAVVFAQTTTLYTKQGATMDRHITSSFQVPAASVVSLISLTIVAFVPIYDRVLIPFARAITVKPSGISMLQRIGTGLLLSFVSVVVAAIVEQKRLASAAEHGLVDVPDATVPMSVWWLVPQYVLFGIADVFAMVGLQEFFYEQVSTELKSIGIALCLSIIGIGGFLSSFLIYVVDELSSGIGRDSWFSDNLNRAHLDYFYWLLAGISALGFAAFVYLAKSFTYRSAAVKCEAVE